MRIRNEAEFLDSSVRSIAGLVDRILLIDNLSSDASPTIIERLRADYPDKVEVRHYPHTLARVGAEHHRLRDNSIGSGSAGGNADQPPELLSSYYNWCLGHCRTPFVLKWDGDMIALPNLAGELSAWRDSHRPIMVFNGANVDAGRHHLIRARCTDHAALQRRLDSGTLEGKLKGVGLPRWATSLSHDFPEPRLFPLEGAGYESKLGWVERLSSPFAAKALKETHRYHATGSCFLHMKFCKADPWAGYSPSLARVIADNVIQGQAMPHAWRVLLEQYGHA